jgi:transcriptional regulator with XRE-family HTH domain
MPDDDCDPPRARARVCCAADSGPPGCSWSNGPVALAAAVRTLRAERGLTVSSLARRAAVDRRTVQRLERGQLRPRLSLLWAIAYGVDPDLSAQVRGRLVAAAVPFVVPDTDASRRARSRRLWAAWHAGKLPLPVYWERRVRLYAASEAMWAVASSLTHRVTDALLGGADEGAPWMAAAGDLGDALRAESALLLAGSGGRVEGLPCRRRMRGGPVDVPAVPPEGADLSGLWRWVREWQVREGRREPRTARERAIAATGAAEQSRLRAHPEPVSRLCWLPDLQAQGRSGSPGHWEGAPPGR